MCHVNIKGISIRIWDLYTVPILLIYVTTKDHFLDLKKIIYLKIKEDSHLPYHLTTDPIGNLYPQKYLASCCRWRLKGLPLLHRALNKHNQLTIVHNSIFELGLL